jgi:hypothetical protein
MELMDEIRNPIREGANLRTFEEWWKTRRAWVPGGSSSMKHRLEELKHSDERIKTGDRPNKIQVAETITLEEMVKHMWSWPVAEARASTKPEPGFKRRALYASDDMSTYIASYASADIEKVASVSGMVAKQTPADVLGWMRADKLRTVDPRRVWLSLDYADFNKEHSKLALFYLNMGLAKMWKQLANEERSSDIMLTKMHCAIWTGISHLNSYSHDLDGAYRKHESGLWSGHRDTARDNTMLHWCYAQMMRDAVLDKVGLEVDMQYLGICGDDEDGLHGDWSTMVAYLGMHRLCGMNLNPAKQLCDWYAHEFLQRQANKRELPFRPIAPMIATLSTGSWYKQSKVYYDSVVTSLSDNCTEIIARGADPEIMMKVIVNIINRMMVIPKRKDMPSNEQIEENIELEWWAYRHGIDGEDRTDSLWHGTGRAMSAPKLEESNFKVGKMAPELARNDWLEDKGKWLKCVDEVKLGWYKDKLLEEAYKSYYGTHRERMRNELAYEAFGERTNNVGNKEIERMIADGRLVYGKKMAPMNAEEMMEMIDASEIDRRPINHELLLDRLHIDNGIWGLMGGWKGFFELAEPEDAAKWEAVPNVLTRQIPTELAFVDPVIKNWWRIKNTQIIDYN